MYLIGYTGHWWGQTVKLCRNVNYMHFYLFLDSIIRCIMDAKQFYGKKYKNLQKAAQKVVERAKAAGNIIIVPPDIDSLTDEKDINGDIIDEAALPNDVPGE